MKAIETTWFRALGSSPRGEVPLMFSTGGISSEGVVA